MVKKWRVFTKRSPKLLIESRRRQIIIPFKPIALVIIVLLSGLSLYLALRSDIFLVNQIEIDGNNSSDCVDDQSLAKEIGLIGKSLVFINKREIRDRILSQHPCLKTINIKTNWPNRVKIEVATRQPVAVLSIVNTPPNLHATSPASLDQFFLVDEEGKVLKKVATFSALPKIDLVSNQSVDLSFLDNAQSELIRQSVRLVSNLSDLQINVHYLIIDNDNLSAFLGDNVLVIFSKKIDARIQTTSLQSILRQSKIEGKQLEKVDLRFTKPHVVYK